MSADVSIEFKFAGAGWADLILKIGQETFVLEGFSYTTDALGDLLRMALMIATGAWTARASFDREPIEWRLIAGNVWDDKPKRWREGFWLRVLEFPDIYKRDRDEAGYVAFEATCEPQSFAKAVADCARRYIAQYGTEKYEWGNNPFPMRALTALSAAMETSDPPLPPPDPNATFITIYESKGE
jgi:hypothetical protein